MIRQLAIVVLVIASSTACTHNRHANTTVRERAGFDLMCPPRELELGVVDTEGARRLATQIAVYGCNQKAVYAYYPDVDTWLIDGAVADVPEDAEFPDFSNQSRKGQKSRKRAQKAKRRGKMDSGY